MMSGKLPRARVHATLPILVAVAALCTVTSVTGQSYTLDSPAGVEPHNTLAEPATFQGKPAIRVVAAPASSGGPEATRRDHLVIAPVRDFSSGTIEVDLAGEPGPGAGGGSRGFVGVAFRVQPDNATYDAFYLRPTNGRANDQERRNHSAQYISHPEWTWFRLRQEAPSRYESYVDIEPAKWIHMKIEVDGAQARLFVDGVDQPTLIVNDVKSGAGGQGAVALWIEGSTVAHFANLKITKKPTAP